MDNVYTTMSSAINSFIWFDLHPAKKYLSSTIISIVFLMMDNIFLSGR